MTISDKITAAAQANGISPAIALAVAQRESGMDQGAVGTHGEIGIFQLMPATAAGLGVDPANLDQNIQGGVRFLADNINSFGLPAGLYAYNWGPGNVQAWLAGRKPLPSSVAAYASWVMARAGAAGAGSPAFLTAGNSPGNQVEQPATNRAFPWGWALTGLGGLGLVFIFLD